MLSRPPTSTLFPYTTLFRSTHYNLWLRVCAGILYVLCSVINKARGVSAKSSPTHNYLVEGISSLRLTKRLTGHILGGATILALGVGLFATQMGSAQVDERYFPETKHTVKGQFWRYWQEHGGLPQQGFPISEEFTEVSDLN